MPHQTGENGFRIEFVLFKSNPGYRSFYSRHVLFSHAFDFAVHQAVERDVSARGPAFFTKGLFFGHGIVAFKIDQPDDPGCSFNGRRFYFTSQVKQGIEGTFPDFYFGKNLDHGSPIVFLILQRLHTGFPAGIFGIQVVQGSPKLPGQPTITLGFEVFRQAYQFLFIQCTIIHPGYRQGLEKQGNVVVGRKAKGLFGLLQCARKRTQNCLQVHVHSCVIAFLFDLSTKLLQQCI